MAETLPIEIKLIDVEPVKRVFAEIAWVMGESESVVGFTADGSPMPWPEVVELYMPTLRRLMGEADGERIVQCEACSRAITEDEVRSDTEGTELCDPCYQALPMEPS